MDFTNGALIAAILTASIALARLWSEKKTKEASAANSISSGYQRLVDDLQEQAVIDRAEILNLKSQLEQAQEVISVLEGANEELRHECGRS